MQIEELELNMTVKVSKHLDDDKYGSICEVGGKTAVVRGAELKMIWVEIGDEFYAIDVEDLRSLKNKVV